MKKALLTGVAALFLATGTAHAEVQVRDATAAELLAIMNKPSFAYAEKDYIWDCASYAWKAQHYHFAYADACVQRNCQSNPPEICAGGNIGHVPRKLRRQQIRELGRVPQERYVK
jgi:hypothetical protein